MKEGIAAVLERFAALRAPAADVRDARRALCLFGAADVLREAVPEPLQPVECDEYEQRVFGPARAALGETAFAAAWAEGRRLSMERAIRLALDE